MFRNYWITATRNLLKRPLYSAINVFGLAAGLACCLLIALFVYNELSFDEHWRNAERIYRIDRDYFAVNGQEEAHYDAMPAPAAPLLEQEFGEVERAARYMCCGVNGQLANGESFTEPAYADADNALFDIFGFEWVSGDPDTALTEPFDLVLTESAARKYFGSADPIGQTLMMQWGPPSVREPRTVKGVIRDIPEESHFTFEMLGSMLSWPAVKETAVPFADWEFNAFHTYVLLREGRDISAVQAGAGAFFDKYLGENARTSTGFTATALPQLYLAPPRSNVYDNQSAKNGSSTTIYTFSALGVFILLLACINFINLTTADSARRAREIGVRKVMGASGGRIGLQFFAESIVLVVLAAVVSLAFAELALPQFNAFMLTNLDVDYFGGTGLLANFLLLVLVTGVIAAGYPSFYLARFQAGRVLRGNLVRGNGGALLRKVLVVLQFSVTIVLLIATAVVYAQMRFVLNVDAGFEKEQIVLSGVNVQPQRWETLKREWLEHPGVLGVTKSMPTPFFQRLGPAPAEIHSSDGRVRHMGFLMVDYEFFETYEVALSAGRVFAAAIGDRPEVQEDGKRITPFIINEMAARQLGWTPEEALGKPLDLIIPTQNPEWVWAGDAEGEVVGVVKDVHWQSARSALQPLVYRMFAEGQGGVASVKISGTNIEDTLAWIDAKWKEWGPAFPISRRFLEQDFAALYQVEQRQAEMLAFFSTLALVISCLGLFGLAAFMTERRTREIGVRKVMGGSVWQIVLLLTNDFSKLVLLSNLLAWPAAYVVMQRWLDNFAYRIDLTPLVFIGSGLIALCIAWVTVGGTAAKAAAQKPVLALRYE